MTSNHFIIASLILSTLTGCVSTPKYELPANVPVATIRANLLPNSNRNGFASVKFGIHGINYGAFYVSSLKPQEFEPIKLQANQSILFYYERHDLDKVCRIKINAILEPNKTYTVLDHKSYSKGLFDTGLFATKYCHFGILDNQTLELIGEYQK